MKVKVIKKLEGGIVADVDLVEIEGKKYIRKIDTKAAVGAETYFQNKLKQVGLPSIRILPELSSSNREMVMEYIDSEFLKNDMSTEHFTKLGKQLAILHENYSSEIQYFNKRGVFKSISWSRFLKRMKRIASKSPYTKRHPETRAAIQNSLKIMDESKPKDFSLIHGDLHPGNIFISDRGLILFDNQESNIYAPVEYELAILVAEIFPDYRYGKELSPGKKSVELMTAFLEAYKKSLDDFPAIDAYCLLRELERYPNRFVRHQDSILENLVNLLK